MHCIGIDIAWGAFNKESQKEMQSFLDFLYLRLSIHFLSFDVIYLA